MKITKRIITVILCIMMTVCAFGTWAFAAPEISSPSAILSDMNSDEILYQKGAYQEIVPAVSAKLMAIYTALTSEAPDSVTVSKEWLDELTNDMQRLGMAPGETYSMKEVLTLLYLSDFNDVYICLANHVGTSQEGFVDMMNDNAKKLGMVSTRYETIFGYEEGKEYTTPYDVHILMKALSREKGFEEITKLNSYTLKPSAKRKEAREINQTLNIVNPSSEWYISGSRFGKLESGKNKLYSIVFSIMRDNREILWISFGSESADGCATEAGEAGEFAFSDFKRVIYTKEEIKKLYKGEKNLYIEPESDIYVTVPYNVDKASLIATVKEENRIATFKVVGNGVNYQKEVSKVKASGIRFIWEGLLTIIRWMLAGIIFIIVLICIFYIPVSLISAKKAKKLREKKEEKVRRLKEKLKENE